MRELILKSDQVERFQFPQQNLTTCQQPFEHLLICTKAWAVEAAVQSIAPRLTAQSVVVLLCNGMGLGEIVAPLIGEARLVLGSTTSGCRRSAENELTLSGEGSTQLGALTHSAEPPSWLPCWQQGVPEPDLGNRYPVSAADQGVRQRGNQSADGDPSGMQWRSVAAASVGKNSGIDRRGATVTAQRSRLGYCRRTPRAGSGSLREHLSQSLVHARRFRERCSDRS